MRDGTFRSYPLERSARLTSRARARSQTLTIGPLGAATVVVGSEGVTVVLVVSELELPQPSRAGTTARAQMIRIRDGPTTRRASVVVAAAEAGECEADHEADSA